MKLLQAALRERGIKDIELARALRKHDVRTQRNLPIRDDYVWKLLGERNRPSWKLACDIARVVKLEFEIDVEAASLMGGAAATHAA